MEPYQCEMCNCLFEHEPVFDELHTYCSDDCLNDAAEDQRVCDIIDQKEYEMYENDFDSWYR